MPKKVIDLTGNRLPALQRQAAAGARLRPLPVGQARANLRNLVEIDVSGMLELLQSSLLRPREQILRELELLYISLFQKILYCGNPTIVSGLRFFQNLHWQTDPSFSFITFYDLFGCPKQFLSMKNLDTSVAAAQASATGMTEQDPWYAVRLSKYFSTCSNCQWLLIHHAYNLRTSPVCLFSRLGPASESAGPAGASGFLKNSTWLRSISGYKIVFLSSSRRWWCKGNRSWENLNCCTFISFNRYYMLPYYYSI